MYQAVVLWRHLCHTDMKYPIIQVNYNFISRFQLWSEPKDLDLCNQTLFACAVPKLIFYPPSLQIVCAVAVSCRCWETVHSSAEGLSWINSSPSPEDVWWEGTGADYLWTGKGGRGGLEGQHSPQALHSWHWRCQVVLEGLCGGQAERLVVRFSITEH